jgi:hypothetical protein
MKAALLAVGFAAVARSPLAVALLPALGLVVAGQAAYILHSLRRRKAIR